MLWPSGRGLDEPTTVHSIQRHLVTVTTDRDLLAGGLAKALIDRAAAVADRDAALEALHSARDELHRWAYGSAEIAEHPGRLAPAPAEGGHQHAHGHGASPAAEIQSVTA